MKAIETESMTKTGHMIKVEVIIGIIRTSMVGAPLEMTGIEVNIIKGDRRTIKDRDRSYDGDRSRDRDDKDSLGGKEEIVDLRLHVMDLSCLF